MFPISLKGSIDTPGIAPEQVIEVTARLISALNRVRAFSVICDGNTITFRGGIFRLVSNWNILVPVNRGVITVSSGSRGVVRYNFSCIEMLVFIALWVVLAVSLIPSDKPTFFRFGAPPLLGLWLFGANYLVAAYRLPAF